MVEDNFPLTSRNEKTPIFKNKKSFNFANGENNSESQDVLQTEQSNEQKDKEGASVSCFDGIQNQKQSSNKRSGAKAPFAYGEQ